ncbi:hypothetical protein M2403_004658 [Rahnella sp. BIGb0603]|uniref:hypothetical protein n=1 Tax=Rahnella sp. BIGb0603 TaxID=2940612 RepID=UPI002169325A|nr:hypothetical protein [Rahnella sp. BIGb0603]MCS3426025.1 hypothetical protein [Rahnella sp. BIGb0603]
MERNTLPAVTEIEVISSVWADRQGEKRVNELLKSGEWVMISTSSGVDRDGYPIHEWVMGKLIQLS